MTRIACSFLALALCLSALTASRAAGVRTVTTTTQQATNPSGETLYGQAAPAAQMTSQAAPASQMTSEAAPAAQTASQGAADMTTQSAPVPQTSTPTTVFPPSALGIFAVDIHFVPGYDLSNAYIAYHYCGSGPGVTQCAIYDGVGQGAKLTAVELIVPESEFQTFSDDEKRLWHSHTFAIQSGTFVLPELSPEQELTTLEGLAATYGKVTDFYHPMTGEPTGNAQTAFGLTDQAQLDQVLGLARQIDQGLNLTTTYEQRAAARKGFTIPAPVPGQDPYHMTGVMPQYAVQLVRVNKNTGAPL